MDDGTRTSRSILTAKHFPYVKSSTLGFGVLKRKYSMVLTKAKQLFVHSITGIVFTQTMPLIIYGIISMEKVGVYGNYLSIINGISQLGQIPFTSMKAGVGSLIVEGDKNKQIGVFKEIFAFNFWLAAIICFGLVFLTQPFVTLWVGHEYLLPDLTLWLMILSFYLSFTRLPFDIYFQAMGMCQDVGAPVVEAVLNIGAAIVLGMKFGLDGIIAGSMAGTLLIVMVWKPYFLFRTGFRVHVRVFLRTKAAGKWRDYSKTIYSQWRLEEDWPPKCWKEPDFSLWFGIENKWRNAFLGKKQGKGHTYPFPEPINMGAKAVCRSGRAAEESDMP